MSAVRPQGWLARNTFGFSKDGGAAKGWVFQQFPEGGAVPSLFAAGTDDALSCQATTDFFQR
jgi:hypothetical protein